MARLEMGQETKGSWHFLSLSLLTLLQHNIPMTWGKRINLKILKKSGLMSLAYKFFEVKVRLINLDLSNV